MQASTLPFFDLQPATSWCACFSSNVTIVSTWHNHHRQYDLVLYPRYKQPLGDFRTEQSGPEADLASPKMASWVLNNQQLAFDSSPVGHLDGFSSPVLLIHGDSDQEVEYEESIGKIFL